MDRRQFFRKGFSDVANVILSAAEERTLEKARYWLRPPYALGELEFLAKCTRCNACIEACPYDVVFELPGARGGDVAGTPALDLLNKGCHLCEDWPCVNACETGALRLDLNQGVASEVLYPDRAGEDSIELNAEQPALLGKLSLVTVNQDSCLPYQGPECGACSDSCPVSAITWHERKPEIDQSRCVGCALCREACITDPKSIHVQKPPRVNQLED